MVFLSMDANFRLKNQVVSNYSQDPGLGTGWAFMVPRLPYRDYVLSRTNDSDVGISSPRGIQNYPLTLSCRSALVLVSRR